MLKASACPTHCLSHKRRNGKGKLKVSATSVDFDADEVTVCDHASPVLFPLVLAVFLLLELADYIFTIVNITHIARK